MALGDPSHVDLTVTDAVAAHRFYDAVLKFLGFVGGEPEGGNLGGWMPESRADVDRMHEFLLSIGATILDPPDGLKLELVHLPGR